MNIPSRPTVARYMPSSEKARPLIEPWPMCHLAIGLLCIKHSCKDPKSSLVQSKVHSHSRTTKLHLCKMQAMLPQRQTATPTLDPLLLNKGMRVHLVHDTLIGMLIVSYTDTSINICINHWDCWSTTFTQLNFTFTLKTILDKPTWTGMNQCQL